jgi:hypothetical protein
MPYWRTDTEYTTVNSVFTWELISGGGSNARVNRMRSRTKAVERPMNMRVYTAPLQNPPNGPPAFSL